MGEKTNSTKLLFWITAVLAALFTIMYVSLIFNKNVWTDEAYTMELIRENGFLGIVKNVTRDVHPPLYYLVVECFVSVFGDDFPVYKTVSIIPVTLTMLLAFSHIRPWWGERAALLFVIMVNAIPCVPEYAVQMRMYSWAMFFVTWAGIGAYGMYRHEDFGGVKRSCIQLTLAAALGCYTHNYAMLACVCIYLILGAGLLLKCRRERKWRHLAAWLVSGCAVSAVYLPWLFVLIGQTADRIGNYWIEPVTGSVILGYPEFLFASGLPGSTAMYLILCAVSVAICLARRDADGAAGLAMLAIPVLTALIGIAVSVLVTPFFIARYLLPCMGLLALFIAIAFGARPGDVQVMLAIFGLVMAAFLYRENYRLEYESTHTDSLLSYMEEHLAPDDFIAYNYEDYGFIYEIYFGDRIKFLGDVDFAGDFGSIWYFDSCETPWLEQRVLDENGLEKEFVMTTGIEQNEFQLYRIRHKK